jgi:hypothetical protein
MSYVHSQPSLTLTFTIGFKNKCAIRACPTPVVARVVTDSYSWRVIKCRIRALVYPCLTVDQFRSADRSSWTWYFRFTAYVCVGLHVYASSGWGCPQCGDIGNAVIWISGVSVCLHFLAPLLDARRFNSQQYVCISVCLCHASISGGGLNDS